jgi:hypothetical protein
MPADGADAAKKIGDFGTVPWQLYGKTAPPSRANGRGHSGQSLGSVRSSVRTTHSPGRRWGTLSEVNAWKTAQ